MKQIIPEKSSEKVAKFLKKNALHKRDFAEMIGVTLSYVYNLIDETVPFSTRGTTIERIATVMNVEPEEFSEYRIPQEPILIDESVETLKSYIKENKLSIVSFLKSFPRKKRIDIVDVLRGALPLPIDYNELKGGYRVRFDKTDIILEIFIFDSLTSGAGYSSIVSKRASEILYIAETILSDCNCSSSCHNCLENFYNQYDVANLDRFRAYELLQYIKNGSLPKLYTLDEQ